MAWEPPKTQTPVRAFRGFTGYYRRFVKDYNYILAPLTELTYKKEPKLVNWTEVCQKAFDALKEAKCSAPSSWQLTSQRDFLNKWMPQSMELELGYHS